MAAGARPFTKAADVLGEATGFQPGKWADETKFSQGYQDSKEAVDAAWKDGSAADIAGAYLSNPAYTANQVAESLPSMVVGGMGSKALLGAGRLANKIGLETAETAMAKIGTGAGADVPLSLKRRVLGGMVSEAVLQELPQSAQEQMWQNFAEGKPIMEGVARAGTEGALAGGVMGAGANLRGGHAAAAPDKQAIDHAVQLDTDITPFFSLDQSGQVTVDLFGKSLNGEVVSLPIDEQTKEKILSYWRATGKRPSSLDEINRYGTRPVETTTPDPARQAAAAPDNTGPTDSPAPDAPPLALSDAPNPVQPSQTMGINPAAGPLSKSAALAVDSGAYMPPAGLAPATVPEPDPVVLQNRDRTSAASIAQMQEIATNPDYLRVGPSRDMTSGAPIVFGDLPQTALLGRPETVVDGKGERMGTQYAVVDALDLIASNNADGTTVAEYATGTPGKLRSVAGNGRTAGLQAAYQMGTAQRYRQELEGDAAAIGVDAQALATMQRPVLVRVMQSADVTRDMGDRTNITATQRLSPLEQAGNDARRLDVRALSFDEGGNPTPDSIKGFVSAMPVSERGDMLNADGTPTRQAVDRLMAATFKQAYESDELVQLYAQATDPDARAVMAAAADASGVLANLKGAGEFDVRGAVADAAKMAVNAARQGLKLTDVLQNADLDMSPEAFPVAAYLAQNIRTPKRMAEGLRRWGQLALEQARIADENTRQGSLLGPQPTLTRAEIFARLGSEANPTGQAIAPPQSPQSNPNDLQAQQAAHTPSAVERHPTWRKNALQAGRVARALGLDPKDKRLAQIVAEIDAVDAQRTADGAASVQQEQAPEPPPSSDLLGDTPNASQQAAADERASREQKTQAQGNAAPAATEFGLDMVDANNGRVIDPGQGSLLDGAVQPESATGPQTDAQQATPAKPKAGVVNATSSTSPAPKVNRNNTDTEAQRQFKETERAYGGREAYDRTKANGKTKLTYGQWVQVRTPNFKAWFGDWEAQASNNVVNQQIEQWASGALPANVILSIGRPSSVLTQYGVPNLPIMLRQAILRKAVKDKHGVAAAELKDIAQAVQAPIAIFDDPDNPGTRIAVTEIRHTDGKIIAAIRLNMERDGLEINDIRSLHPKRDSSVLRWIDDGLLLGLDKSKGRAWLENLAATSPQQPQASFTALGEILYDADSVRNASKVVDPDTGEPMVAYHGIAFDFDALDTETPKSHHQSKAMFFTSEKDIASEYAIMSHGVYQLVGNEVIRKGGASRSSPCT